VTLQPILKGDDMNDSSSSVRLPSSDDFNAPVTVLDADGHVVRVVPASAFRSSQTRIAASQRPSSGSVRAGVAATRQPDRA
jgi:hypothetical protein